LAVAVVAITELVLQADLVVVLDLSTQATLQEQPVKETKAATLLPRLVFLHIQTVVVAEQVRQAVILSLLFTLVLVVLD
jgi:hypothetical protein